MDNKQICELYGGPLDGIELAVPEVVFELAKVLALPVNLSPDSGFITIDDISPEYRGTTAIYIRETIRTFKFKEIDDGTTDITTYKTEDTLDQIKGLCNGLKTLNEEIKEAEQHLDHLVNKRKHIEESLLPDLFSEAGISDITMDDGRKVVLKEFYVGSMKNPGTTEWLDRNGFGDLIKNTLTINFGRGENSLSKELKDYLIEKGLGYSDKEAVHHATLRSFINEQIEVNPDFPRELFNVTAIRKVETK